MTAAWPPWNGSYRGGPECGTEALSEARDAFRRRESRNGWRAGLGSIAPPTANSSGRRRTAQQNWQDGFQRDCSLPPADNCSGTSISRCEIPPASPLQREDQRPCCSLPREIRRVRQATVSETLNRCGTTIRANCSGPLARARKEALPPFTSLVLIRDRPGTPWQVATGEPSP